MVDSMYLVEDVIRHRLENRKQADELRKKADELFDSLKLSATEETHSLYRLIKQLRDPNTVYYIRFWTLSRYHRCLKEISK